MVDVQGRAYNARDLDAYVALYAADATISDAEAGTTLARGHAEIRAFYGRRFDASPGLRLEVMSRLELGSFVIDLERVDGIGDRPLEVIAIYEVRDSLIRSLQLVTAAP